MCHRLVDGDSAVVEGVSAWFAEMQAVGRSASALRSYGMDLLRWFRFLWWSGWRGTGATREEARDFCRWLQLAAKPARVHWRHGEQSERAAPAAGPSVTMPYSASVRAHSETVLRGFYDVHREAGAGPDLEPVPAGPQPGRRSGPCPSQTDGGAPERADGPLPAEGAGPDPAQRS